jgi:predicted SAM-dependent methyltransferase
MKYMKYLNLGCGSRFHPDWTNIDITSTSPSVQTHDLRQGIPYPNDTFNVVYHSHVLEHFPKHDALGFSQECYRVLKLNGIIRVVVPDLEQITRVYIRALEKACQADTEWQHHYEWMMLELYDQTVRERPGGAMLDYLIRVRIPNEAFVYQRMGGEVRHIVENLHTEPIRETALKSYKLDWLGHLRQFFHDLRMKFIQRLLGDEQYKALQIGLFRLCGEVHQWMYDRYSLAQLLKRANFCNPTQCNAFKSQIENWQRFVLDTEPDGTVYKPDSLYMEAFKR